MFLKDLSKEERKQQSRGWNVRLKRVSNSAKYSQNYYVLAGKNPTENEKSWYVTQVACVPPCPGPGTRPTGCSVAVVASAIEIRKR